MMNKNKLVYYILLKKIFLFSLIISLLGACNNTTVNNNELKKSIENTNVSQSSIEAWKKMKFGLFIHWGVYSIPAGVWKGKQIEKLGEQIMRHADISIPEYEAIAKQFNPTKFNADSIVSLAKTAGMKYVILTSKHHDGFAMFKTKTTDYNIVDYTPYKKDVLKQLAEACKKQGLKLGLYYSTPDWHFNGPKQERNFVDGKISVFGKVSKENEEFQVKQLEELLTNYGEIVELFFDMGEPTEQQSKRFRETVKRLQPNCLINGRVMNNQGDFITMPDNHLPDTPIKDIAWETPGTFYHTWGYKSWVNGSPLKEQIKEQIIKLSKIACMGGNYLLNIGPKSDGTVLKYESDVLKGVGKWVKTNSEAIFDTEPNPFKNLSWGVTSYRPKENKLYLHVINWPTSGKLKIPGLQNTIKKAYFLDGKNQNKIENISVEVKELSIGNQPVDDKLSVIVVEYEGDLSIDGPFVQPNSKGYIELKDSDAVKHGKYGMKSYRSIIKDNLRSWDVNVVEAGVYDVQIVYKMKFDSKEFILQSGEEQLRFNLKGKAPETARIDELFDGNETLNNKEDQKKVVYGKSKVGSIILKKGNQLIEFKSGKEFEFKTTFKEFRSQSKENRGLNIDAKLIRLIKR